MHKIILIISSLLLTTSIFAAKSSCKNDYYKCLVAGKSKQECKMAKEKCKRGEEGLSCLEIFEKRHDREMTKAHNIADNVGPLMMFFPSLPITGPIWLWLETRADNIDQGNSLLSNKLSDKGQIEWSNERQIYVTSTGADYSALLKSAINDAYGFNKGQVCENYPKLWSYHKTYKFLKDAMGSEIVTKHGHIVNVAREKRKEAKKEQRRAERELRRAARDK